MKYSLLRVLSLILLSSGAGSQGLAKSGLSLLKLSSKSCLSLLVPSPSPTSRYLLEGVDESNVLEYLYQAGLRIVGFNDWGLPIVDGRKTHEDMVTGFSGAVLMQIKNSRTIESLSSFGLNVTQEFVPATDTNPKTGNILYIYELSTGRIVFTGVTIGWESNIEAFSSVASERLGQYVNP